MAGEHCGRGCAWCGRCDAEPDFECDCRRAGCRGDCDEPDADGEERCDDTEDISVTATMNAKAYEAQLEAYRL